MCEKNQQRCFLHSPTVHSPTVPSATLPLWDSVAGGRRTHRDMFVGEISSTLMYFPSWPFHHTVPLCTEEGKIIRLFEVVLSLFLSPVLSSWCGVFVTQAAGFTRTHVFVLTISLIQHCIPENSRIKSSLFGELLTIFSLIFKSLKLFGGDVSAGSSMKLLS